MSKAQGYFGAEARDFNLYAKPIPKCGLECQSFTNSHTTLKYCSNVIHELGNTLGLQRWEIGASLIRYRINNSSKPL